ncbi:hypothetical protein B484DRAFT_403707, partial [Ochromonadaceae sp. CCMP2298]
DSGDRDSRDRDGNRDSGDRGRFDEFRCRELCLTAAAQTKAVADYLSKVASSLASSISNNNSNNNSNRDRDRSRLHLPQEALLLNTCSAELASSAVQCTEAFSQCLQSRKTVYLTQLRKIREISNMATRNAVQHERSEAGAHLSRLKLSQDQQRAMEFKTLTDRISSLEGMVAGLEGKLGVSQAEGARLLQLEANSTALRGAAVGDALQQLTAEHEREKASLHAAWAAEQAKILTSAEERVAEVRNTAEARLGTQRTHDGELRQLVSLEKGRVEDEAAKLRLELVSTVAKLTSEKEWSIARIQEERERNDRDQQQALAEAVRGQ